MDGMSRPEPDSRKAMRMLLDLSINMLNFPFRMIWTVFQILLFLPFLFLISVFVDMSFAEPGKGYIAKSGQAIKCEALAPRSKSGQHCSAFGSKETNPIGYGLVVSSIAGVIILGWWCGRPGRGIPSYRMPSQRKG